MVRWRLLLLIPAACIAGTAVPALAAPVPASANVAATPAAQVVYAFNSGLALTAGAAAPGAAVRIQPAGGAAQKWAFGANGTIALAANPHLCLTVSGAGYRSGTKLDVTTCHAGAAQRFARSSPSAHSPVYFVAVAAHRGLCVADLAGLLSAGDRAGLRPCAALISQAWSARNLAGVASAISGSRVMQAQRVAAGQPVTAVRLGTSSLGQYWTASYAGAPLQDLVRLHPVQNTALCVTAAAANAPLKLAGCGSAPGQQLMATAQFYSAGLAPWLITTADALSCVQPAAGTGAIVPVVTGTCASSREAWDAALPLNRLFYSQYLEMYADSGGGLQLSMTVAAKGGPGSGVTIQADRFSPGQVWTDLASGPSQPPGNPDGSISLRPLSDQALCLTVPNANYAAGVQLTVQPCAAGAADQEFLDAPTSVANGRELIARGDGRFCAGEPGSAAAGNPVELEPCDQAPHQAWMQYYGWSSFAGAAPFIASQTPGGPRVTLTPGTGEVGLAAAAPGSTAQFWEPVTGAHGFSLQSVYDPGLCLDAASQTPGTVLDAATCDGGAGQRFTAFVQQGTETIGYKLAGLCVTAAASPGPLSLQTCAATPEADQEWVGPS